MVTIDGYPLDLVESEEHVLSSEITEHPVEQGSDISDNIRRKPRELTLTNAVVSDTPIGAIALDDTRILGETLPPVSQEAYRRLEAIWLAGEPVAVVTGFKKYDSMGLLELTVPRESKNAGGLVFTAKFKEIIIKQNKRVTMKAPNTGGEQNLGLSLDKLIDGSKVLWRKGKPPGTSPSTAPAGVIVGQEVVTIKQAAPGKNAKFLHPNGKELTTEEYHAFTADLNRDTALLTNRGLARVEQNAVTQHSAEDKRIQRAEDLANYKTTHPGENVDPAMFGFTPGASTVAH